MTVVTGSVELDLLPASSIVDVAEVDLAGATVSLPTSLPAGLPARLPAIRTRLALGPRRTELLTLAAADAVALLLAVAVLPVREAPVLTAVAAAVWVRRGLYRTRCHLAVLDQVPTMAAGVGLGVLAAGALHDTTVVQAGAFGALVLAVLVPMRTAALAWLRWCRVHGGPGRSTLVVGAGERAAELVRRIREHPESGLLVCGVLGDVPAGLEDEPRRGDLEDLSMLLADGLVDTVIVGDAAQAAEVDVVDQLRACSGRPLDVYVLPRLVELTTTGSDDQVWGVPLHRLASSHRPVGGAVKRLVDVVAALLALALAAPLLVLAALAARVELGPGVLFRQERIGRGGRRFQLLKLRTMHTLRPGVDAGWATDARRVGPVGAFLRRYSLDELPQLLNVLRGDMSLVGPRPERPEYVEQFGSTVPSYVHRHRMMVGLTGLASVEGLRGDTSIEERARFDNWYIENWSFWLDAKILVRTVTAVLRGTGG